MKQSIQLRLGQHLTMTPQLQQAIRLLQLSTLDLQREIQDALDSNLMLEEGDESDGAGSVEEALAHPHLFEELADAARGNADDHGDREVRVESTEMPDDLPVDTQWADVFDSYQTGGGAGGDDHAEFDPFAHQSRPHTLHDHLVWQLNLSRLNERDMTIALAVIDAIDTIGYLRATHEDLRAALDLDDLGALEIDTQIHRVQSLDPPGVGARDVRECLLIQLRQLPPETPHRALAIAICEQGFEALPRKDVGALTRLLKRQEAEVLAALELIQCCHPRPGNLIAEAPSEYVVPDIFVRRREGRWLVELNPDSMPKLRVNADYARLIRRTDQSTDATTMRSHLQEARWFIKSLASRNDTVLRVGAKIVEMQQAFFDYGEEAMRPLVLRDIAEALELHESTVSRVTTQKYMHTPRGTFEFKYFFSSHVNTASGGECSSTAIRALIRKLIAGESTLRPLSDSRIASELSGQGIRVARRTVAKYREAMGIPPSNERKRLA